MSSRTSQLLALVLAVVVACIASSRPSHAQPAPSSAAPTPRSLAETLTGVAKEDYEAGKLVFVDGDYAAARVKFMRAYDASKDARLLWNVAACEKGLRHYAKAMELVRRYTQEGGALLTAQDRQEADELVRALEPFTTPVRFVVNEPGATVWIDDEVIGTTPIAKAVRVDLGSRRIVVRKPHFFDDGRDVVVSGAAEVTIAVTMRVEIHQGRLVVRAGTKDTIAVDGRIVGVGTFSGVLPSGGHTLRVTNAGMRALQNEVLVQDDQTRTIDVTLEPLAKGGVPTWVWIAGGAVLAAGAVGGYFLLKPKDESSPPTAGTINTVQLRSW